MKTKATPTGSDDFTLGFQDGPVGRTPVSASEAATFFGRLNSLLKSTPPSLDDASEDNTKTPPIERAA